MSSAVELLNPENEPDLALLVSLGYAKEEAWWLLHDPNGREILNKLRFYRATLKREDTETHKDVGISAQSRRLRLPKEILIENSPLEQLLQVERALKPELEANNGRLEKDIELTNWHSRKVTQNHIAASLTNGSISVIITDNETLRHKLPVARAQFHDRHVTFHFTQYPIERFYSLSRNVHSNANPEVAKAINMLIQGTDKLLQK
ncbi:MAG TPA: hypothetical protein VF189_05345 [Patescibacteria group bacterium]